MTRDTATAIWYRRIDRRCFTNHHSSSDANDRPAMETSYAARTEPEATVHTPRLSDDWPALANDRRGWAIDAVADRL
jgi:hypothetical protein